MSDFHVLYLREKFAEHPFSRFSAPSLVVDKERTIMTSLFFRWLRKVEKVFFSFLNPFRSLAFPITFPTEPLLLRTLAWMVPFSSPVRFLTFFAIHFSFSLQQDEHQAYETLLAELEISIQETDTSLKEAKLSLTSTRRLWYKYNLPFYILICITSFWFWKSGPSRGEKIFDWLIKFTPLLIHPIL